MRPRIAIDFEPDPADPTGFARWIAAEELSALLRSGDDAWIAAEDVDAMKTRLLVNLRSRARLRRAVTVIEAFLARKALRASVVVLPPGS